MANLDKREKIFLAWQRFREKMRVLRVRQTRVLEEFSKKVDEEKIKKIRERIEPRA
ncbi:hypothetical protein HYT45_02820 [Candidatus Uhrbacteria bacterium]|nr:hypothetical protein [Candidatus Uhrbacteria bacterium]